ncbi:GLPGLI family protein [Chryseobacterium sp. CT-SW4]|uniref:GLPGLI family protein n=1 Tax=Chryseobacterium sp. SW-1 TaxID=3157343 RepID=UPI003B0240B0
MCHNKKILQFLILFSSIFSYSQFYRKDTLRGDFIYLLKAKLNTQSNHIHEEYFSLQIGDNRAFFASVQSIKADSVYQKIPHKKLDNGAILISAKGMSIPKTKFPYRIIQSGENIQYFRWVAMTALTYKEPIIDNWKLINESKVINSFNCKKAEVSYKGRNWIAWYSTEIPFPYGPYKFGGLPGLIIKIVDDKGDYDFELVKSVSNTKLNGKLTSINIEKYRDAVETTQYKFEKALKNANENAIGILQNSGTTIIQGQEILQQRIKERQLNLKYENPIELSIE